MGRFVLAVGALVGLVLWIVGLVGLVLGGGLVGFVAGGRVGLVLGAMVGLVRGGRVAIVLGGLVLGGFVRGGFVGVPKHNLDTYRLDPGGECRCSRCPPGRNCQRSDDK